MAYRHINNLYKDKTILMFKRIYAMEKIHGTSAHISFKYQDYLEAKEGDKPIERNYTLNYFSGGEKYDNFLQLFNDEELIKKALELDFNKSFIVYGEAYGGRQQRMAKTYGDQLRFVAFEVQIGDNFVNVPFAEQICNKLGIEFVHYEEIDADPDLIDKLANSPSVQAKRNGVENPELPREGVVLRPLQEFKLPDGEGRIIIKHKNNIYKEREHAPKLKDANQLKILEDARKIADEWVVEMRLEHVLDKLKANGMEIEEKRMNDIIKVMVEDVYREANGEIVESRDVYKAIGKKTAKLFIERMKRGIK